MKHALSVVHEGCLSNSEFIFRRPGYQKLRMKKRRLYSRLRRADGPGNTQPLRQYTFQLAIISNLQLATVGPCGRRGGPGVICSFKAFQSRNRARFEWRSFSASPGQQRMEAAKISR